MPFLILWIQLLFCLNLNPFTGHEPAQGKKKPSNFTKILQSRNNSERAGLSELSQLSALPFPHPKMISTHAALKWFVNESSCKRRGEESVQTELGEHSLKQREMSPCPSSIPGLAATLRSRWGERLQPPHNFFTSPDPREQLLCQARHESDCCWRKSFCLQQRDGNC